jgi:hypothetical protein
LNLLRKSWMSATTGVPPMVVLVLNVGGGNSAASIRARTWLMCAALMGVVAAIRLSIKVTVTSAVFEFTVPAAFDTRHLVGT